MRTIDHLGPNCTGWKTKVVFWHKLVVTSGFWLSFLTRLDWGTTSPCTVTLMPDVRWSYYNVEACAIQLWHLPTNYMFKFKRNYYHLDIVTVKTRVLLKLESWNLYQVLFNEKRSPSPKIFLMALLLMKLFYPFWKTGHY